MRLPQFRQFVVAIALFACCTVSARSELLVASPSIDLGVIRGGRNLTHRFELFNRGAEGIEILDVQRGCGCLSSKLSQRVIPPGGKMSLPLELRTLGQADGPHTWDLQVQYRAGKETKSLALSLRGTVQSEITVQPAILGLHVTKTVQQEITLTDVRPTPLRVVDVDVRAAGVKVTGIARAGKTTKITVTADGTQLAVGRHEGVLTITTDDADYGQLSIPIVVTKASESAVRCVPEQVELRLLQGAPSASTVVRLRSANDQPVRIAKIKSSDPSLNCTWATGPGNDATVRIQTLAAKGITSSQGFVEVHFAEPQGESVRIPVAVQAAQ